MSEEQKEEAYEKVQMVYDSLKMGTDFALMAKHLFGGSDFSQKRGRNTLVWNRTNDS